MIYIKYFNDSTSAKHIFFVFALYKAIEKKKKELMAKSKAGKIQELEKKQLHYLRKRGSLFLLITAIANSLEIYFDDSIPNLFSIKYNKNIKLEEAIDKWQPIINISVSFVSQLNSGLSDGFRTNKVFEEAICNFRELINSTKEANKAIYNTFKKAIIY